MLYPYQSKIPLVGKDVFVAESAVIIGDVEIGDGTNIWYQVAIRGDENYIRIGGDTNIQDGVVVHVTEKNFPTHIGSRITIGHMALIHGCTLEDESFVGMKACVMDGAVVESHAMVAAGALVSPGKRVRTGELWAGVPARFMRPLTMQEQTSIPFFARHYRELAAAYLAARMPESPEKSRGFQAELKRLG